jgi:uncharacterized RDD family membrane protein YckC
MEPITTPNPAQTIFQYAGFWKRFLAWCIDKIILGAVSMIIFIPFIGILGLGALHFDDLNDAPVSFIVALIGAYLTAITLFFIIEWLYYAIMESRKGATFGKMALGIIVLDMNGRPVSFGRATGRYFAKILSGLILCVGYIIAGFTQQKQALHDILAGCLVVNK